jgi:hypothetical protein
MFTTDFLKLQLTDYFLKNKYQIDLFKESQFFTTTDGEN